VIDEADYAVWRSAFGVELAAGSGEAEIGASIEAQAASEVDVGANLELGMGSGEGGASGADLRFMDFGFTTGESTKQDAVVTVDVPAPWPAAAVRGHGAVDRPSRRPMRRTGVADEQTDIGAEALLAVVGQQRERFLAAVSIIPGKVMGESDAVDREAVDAVFAEAGLKGPIGKVFRRGQL